VPEGLLDPEEAQLLQLAAAAERAIGGLGRGDKEAGVEAAEAVGRRHRAAEIVERGEVGQQALPLHPAEDEAGLLLQLARGGDADGPRQGGRGWRSRQARVKGGSSPRAGARWSARSTRPPGKTRTFGMKRCEAWRRPISTSTPCGPRRQRMRLAA
jgi:hypothetical protein